MTRVGALWIGGLEPYMDETFLNGAMMTLGQDGIVSIKVMNNRYTGQPAGYGFINFESDQKAIYVMHRLGGKVIPNSNPPVRFKLNHNSTRLQAGEIDTSVWVGDLTPEVDDFHLYQFFTARYSSVRCAKVVLDEAGTSKGYGFVRFGLETEQQHALANMTGEHGLGSKPIKVSMANQKNRRIPDNSTPWGPPPPESAPSNNNEAWPTSPPAVAAPWPPNSNTSNMPPPPAPHTPDYNLYQYYQYAQQFNQQQYAAAWTAWQQQQQQQQ
ncbi:tRNA selenocysteine 1-associated protein 1 [Lepeophtheirus salmonis]|nr:tRNA selenocysteine 1-associated protein 1-like [Lepeophtheirus salmonis]